MNLKNSNEKSITSLAVPGSFDSGLIKGSEKIGNANLSTVLTLSIEFHLTNKTGLMQYLAKLHNPKSADYMKFLNQKEFINSFSPSVHAYNVTKEWLMSNGLDITGTYPDRFSITIVASVQQIEKVFDVKYYEYASNGILFIAPSSPLMVPVSIYPYISGISGTNTYMSERIHTLSSLVSPQFTTQNYIYSSDLQKAYDTIELYNNSATGAASSTHIFANGRSIVLILWEDIMYSGNKQVQVAPYNPSDVFYYYNNYMPLWERKAGGIPHIWGIPIPGSGAVKPGSNASSGVGGIDYETCLDIEFSGMQAPGSNVIYIYGPGYNYGSKANPAVGPEESNFPDTEMEKATTIANLSAVSNSWGAAGDYIADNVVNDTLYEMEARGVTVFASSGDSNVFTPPTATPPSQVSFPANVANNSYGYVAVGGTELTLYGTPSSDGTGTNTINPIKSQTVWGNVSGGLLGPYYGTTAGASFNYSMPSWQNIPSVTTTAGTTTDRLDVDVAALGDYAEVYVNGALTQLMGTSIASPTVAGQITEIDAYLGIGSYGMNNGLGFADPLFYQIGNNNSKYAQKPFFDITQGGIGETGTLGAPAVGAGPGWDYPSGWGSINSWNFTMALKFWMNSNPHSLTIAAGLSGSTTVSVYYPTLYNSSVYLSVTGLPAGVTASFSSNVVDPSPNNKTAGTSTLTINTAATTTPNTYTLTVTGVNYNKNSNTHGNLTNITTLILTISPPPNVKFTETGLPSGTKWYVNLSNGQSFSSTTTTISFNEGPGTYTYSVATGDKEYAPSPATGSFTAGPGVVSESVTFSLVTYSVTFTESGLPSGTIWYVNITGGASHSSTTSTITFSEPNGTYSYSIATGNKEYAPSPASGSFTVNGAVVSESITFSLVTYRVTFTESGLPPSTIWYVNITGGNSYSSTTSTITFSELNGSYSYTVATGNKEYAPSPASGSFTINGTVVSESVTFSLVTYSVTFTESRLPSGTIWSVTLNGVTEHSTASDIVFTEPNGTYAYSTGYVTKYTTSFASGNVTVNGNAVTQKIIFSSTSTSSTSTNTLSITSAYLYSIIIAIIIAVVVIVAIMLMKKRGKQSGANMSANNTTYTQGTMQNGMGGGGQFPPQSPPVQPPVPPNQ